MAFRRDHAPRYDNKVDKAELKKANKAFENEKQRERDEMRRMAHNRNYNYVRDPYVPDRGAHYVDRRRIEQGRTQYINPVGEEPAIVIRRDKGIKTTTKKLAGRARETARTKAHSAREAANAAMDKAQIDPNWSTFEPVADLAEAGGFYVVRVELPGVRKENLSVEVKDNILYVKGKKERGEKPTVMSNTGAEEVVWLSTERGNGKFKREIELPEFITEPNKVEALYKFGVLEVFIPRTGTTTYRGNPVTISHA
eukprot:TRINITY_DN14652_c0_g1_i1.p1 TRINITY_DN14652_c0_g1~~TRINITY_DN14652_c0_g1_i1.p1  ORF type:complete len:254 (-),score=80.83 TRINITY_DN14652_c0_g1_i1:69-830(-)